MRQRQKKAWLVYVGLAILLLVLAGCNDGDDGAQPIDLQEEPPAIGGNLDGHGEAPAIVVTDGAGVRLEFPRQVERVVCLTEICADSLAELGILPAAAMPGGVAGEPEFFGERARSIPQIGGSFFEPSLEDIAKAQPDLVIGLYATHDGLRDALKSIAPLYIADIRTYQDSIDFLDMMGGLTGHEEAATAAKQAFLGKLDYYKAQSPNNRSALIMYGSDINFGIDTAGSLVGGLMAEVTPYPWPAPASDEGHQAGGMAYSLEKVLETDPDHLFIETFMFGPGGRPLSEQFQANPLWSRLRAVRENQATEVRTAIWANGRGTRSLGIVLDEGMRILYPDVFKEAAN